MDGSSFHKLAQLAATGAARRGVLKSGVAAILAGLGAAPLLAGEDAEAKASRRKRRRRRCQPRPPESPCQTSKDCCTKKTKYICGTSHGSGSDTCCGTQGAVCGSTLNCCTDQCCVGGRCVPGPCV